MNTLTIVIKKYVNFRPKLGISGRKSYLVAGNLNDCPFILTKNEESVQITDPFGSYYLIHDAFMDVRAVSRSHPGKCKKFRINL